MSIMPEPKMEMSQLKLDAAREWLKKRIVEQAAAEGEPLTQVERRYLDYELIDSDAEAEAVEREFSNEHPPGEFLQRAARLLQKAFTEETERDPSTEVVYREAYRAVVGAELQGPLSRFVRRAFSEDVRFKVL